MNLVDVLEKIKIIPITILRDIDDALKVAEVLIQNSINLIEVTLRTEIANKCIKAINQNFPDILLGCGSVLTKNAFEQAIEDGAKFGVAPALDMEIVEYASSIDVPFVPGVTTPTELNTALKSGLDIIKIFPATNLGGAGYIKAITAPFRTMDFHLIPTGGINENNLLEYLQQDKVIACGATYIVDSKLIEKGDFIELKNRIKQIKTMISNFNKE